MIPRELIRKIRRIQIRTSRIVDELLAGQYESAFRGRGIEFEEVRPYQVGDDVRSIDWNVTARTDQPHVKLFREERELSVRLLVDLSASQGFGTHWQSKRELAAELAATLVFAAVRNNDKVGLTLFTDGIEKSVPPAKGSRHGLRLIREILYTEPVGQGTDLAKALEHLSHTARRRSVVFVISDFLAPIPNRQLKIAARRHDLIPIVVEDPREREMPNLGMVRLQDAETGQSQLIDTASRRIRESYRLAAKSLRQRRDDLFRRLKLDPIQVTTGEDFVEPLKHFFQVREKARSPWRRR